MRLFLIAILLIMSSCATVLKKSTYKLNVVSPGADDKVEVDGKVYPLPADILVKRSKEDLHIRLLSDTTSIDFTVEAYPHGTFLYANLLWSSVCPVAYAIDLTNPKRFHYGRQIVLNRNATQLTLESPVRKELDAYFGQKFPRQKGDFVFVGSVPLINNFYLQPEGQSTQSSTGVLGVSLGLDYFYKNNRYVSLSTGIVTDGVPIGEFYEGPLESMSSTYVTLTNNHQRKRFHWGYGFNLSRNRWRWEYLYRTEPTPIVPILEGPIKYIKRSSTGVGFTLDAYHQAAEHFMVGIIYRPTLFRFDPAPKWAYEHVISLDFKILVSTFQSKKKTSEQK